MKKKDMAKFRADLKRALREGAKEHAAKFGHVQKVCDEIKALLPKCFRVEIMWDLNDSNVRFVLIGHVDGYGNVGPFDMRCDIASVPTWPELAEVDLRESILAHLKMQNTRNVLSWTQLHYNLWKKEIRGRRPRRER